MAIQTRQVSFNGAQGDVLAANLELPQSAPKAFALFAHCFTCSKDMFAAKRIARALAERGIAVLRFDFTGLGHSEGEFANTNFSSNVGDLLAATEFLRAEYEAPKILIGHSLGGAAVLLAAGRVPECAAVATINAPSEPGHIAHLLVDATKKINEKGVAEVEIGGRRFSIRKQFLDDIAQQSMREAIARLRRALLIFHAPRDEIVGIDSAAQIFGWARHPKSFVSLDDADHLLSRKEDAHYVADVLSAWASRYIDVDDHETAGAAPEDGSVMVTENGNGKFGQDIVAGPHLCHADEPVDAGGLNAGPTPYQLLSAALGACTSMTMRLYADRKGWPLEKASVTVRHDKIHATDCADCETREGRVDVFDREIRLDGLLDAEQRQRILEIADKCPVHRTLHSEVKVRTRLVDS